MRAARIRAHGGMVFGTDPPQLWEAGRSMQGGRATFPLMVKLFAECLQILVLMARVAEDGGADAVSLVNTFVSLAIDVETPAVLASPILPAGSPGRRSRPIAVRMVHEVSKGSKDSCGRNGWNPAKPEGRCGVS